MMMSKTEANNKPVLAADDVHIVTVYAFKFGKTLAITVYAVFLVAKHFL